LKLEDSDINHVRKVLRLSKGDEIIVFNGEKEYLAKLGIVSREVIMANIIKQLREEDFSKGSKVEITLFQGLLRAGKLDDILEKTTELGVDNIVPIECEFSQMKLDVAFKKISRWNKILVSASEQSERIRLPDLIEPMKFEESLTHLVEFDEVYFFTTDNSNELRNLVVKKNKEISKIACFIGPEGGFSPREHELAKNHKLEFYTLNKSILRAETAAIFSVGVLNFLYN
jgi:16S rRNA (uracil1498-N3)-methyltransferase